MCIESMMPSNHLILCRPLLLHSVFLSIRIFSSESALHISWPNIGASALTSILPMKYWGQISFRIDWFDLLVVQGILKILLKHHSLKALILWHYALFMVQLSNLYILLEKPQLLTIWTFVSKVMSLLFNTLSKFIIAFLPRSKCPLISWLQLPSLNMYIPHLLIHSSIDGHLDCFHVLATVNNAAVNIGLHVSFQRTVFSRYMPRSWTFVSYGNSLFSFLRNLHTSTQ